MKVFELAKELSVPVKQLLLDLRLVGINHIKDPFHVLTEEQIAKIRQRLTQSTTPDASSVASAEEAEAARRRRFLRPSTPEVTQAPEPSVRVLTELHHPDAKARRIRKTVRSDGTEIVHNGDHLPSSPSFETPTETIPVTEPLPSAPEVFSVELPVETEVETVLAPVVENQPVEIKPEPVEVAPAPVAPPKSVVKTEEPVSRPPQSHKMSAPPPITVPKSKESPKNGGGDHNYKKKLPEPPKSEKEKEKEKDNKDKKGVKVVEKDIRVEKKVTREEEPHFKKKLVVTVNLSELEEAEETSDWIRPRRKMRGDRRRHAEKHIEPAKHTFNPRRKSIKIGPSISVGELAGAIGIKAVEIIKKLMGMGIMVTINQSISGDTAALVAADFNIEVELETYDMEDSLHIEEEQLAAEPRAPIVTIMGHVDHGKTSLLDKIRSTRVALGEAGGITQHIGAYHVQTDQGNITFLDTPGHEAFTAMRARGANVTDIVVLVVAADDGVQPQTIEAIHHAQAAKVPIIVAVNKIDRPEANPSRVQQELLQHSLVAESLGGETIFVPVSAKMGLGIDQLLEMIHLQAEILELSSPVTGRARGVIIESKISKGRGPVGTVLIQRGTLKIGEYYVVGSTYGRVRAMFNDRGLSMTQAGPAIPAEVNGFNEVPTVGETFIVVEDERQARHIAETRSQKTKAAVASAKQKLHLENLFNRISAEVHTVLSLVVKADVQGSVEALQSSLSQIGNDKVSVRFIHTAVGNITETDVMLASASDAIIIAFNVSADSNTRAAAAREGVDLRFYSIIYDAIEEVKKALQGLLQPVVREEVIGHFEVRKIFTPGKSGTVIGGMVTDGRILRNSQIRLLRKGQKLYEGHLNSLRRFKDDVREVVQNYECGVGLDFNDVQEGDIIEAYVKVEESATL